MDRMIKLIVQSIVYLRFSTLWEIVENVLPSLNFFRERILVK
jgi:hypothetical protein